MKVLCEVAGNFHSALQLRSSLGVVASTYNALLGGTHRVTEQKHLTYVGIHPGRVEPTLPIELTTSLTEALQARRSCARLSPNPFSIMRGRRLAVRRGVPGLP